MIAVCSLAMGFFVDFAYKVLDVQASAVVGQASELFPESVQLISAVILTGLIVFNMISNFRQQAGQALSH